VGVVWHRDVDTVEDGVLALWRELQAMDKHKVSVGRYLIRIVWRPVGGACLDFCVRGIA
jgi:hypothetical protein